MKNVRKSFNVFEVDKARQGNSNLNMRVTYDFNGKPIVQLPDQRKYDSEDSHPLKQYWKLRQSNNDFFGKLKEASSLDDKLKLSK